MTQPKYMCGLGFRKMELFNLAFLAKQGWRIIQESNSPSARILKEVYFSDRDFLSVELGSRSSQVWRSIVEGREVLKQGLVWRIGDGQTTHIWNDNWLPRESVMRPLAQLQQGPVMVVDLTDPVNRTWNQNVLVNYFLPWDANVI